jgi:hypothetical protein
MERYISICTPFYPWHKGFDRTEELFDVLIPSLNKSHPENFELVILDCGCEDVYNLNREKERNIIEFNKRLKKEFKGKLVYIFNDQCISPITHKEHGFSKRGYFWMANAVNLSIKNSTSDYIFIMNIDIEISNNFYEEYFKNVSLGKVWFPKCYHIKKTDKKVNENGVWRLERGLVGITKADYWSIGGTDSENYIKDRHDSDLYERCIKTFNIKEEKLLNFFHIDHPGTNVKNSDFRYKTNL